MLHFWRKYKKKLIREIQFKRETKIFLIPITKLKTNVSTHKSKLDKTNLSLQRMISKKSKLDKIYLHCQEGNQSVVYLLYQKVPVAGMFMLLMLAFTILERSLYPHVITKGY